MLQEKRICPYCGKELPEYMTHGNRKYHPECALLKQQNASRLYQQNKLIGDLPTAPKPKMKDGMMLVPGMTREEQVRRWSKAIKGHEEYVRRFESWHRPAPSIQPTAVDSFLENWPSRPAPEKKKEVPPHTHRTKYSTARTEDGRDVVIEHRF